jgi:hypothetical protein
MPDAGASRKRQIQFTPRTFRGARRFAHSPPTADIRYRAFRRMFPGSVVSVTRRTAQQLARRARCET